MFNYTERNRRYEDFYKNFNEDNIYNNIIRIDPYLFNMVNIFTLFIDTTQSKEKYKALEFLKNDNKIDDEKTKNFLKYFYPYLYYKDDILNDILTELNNEKRNFDQKFLDFLEYNGEIKTCFFENVAYGCNFY